MLIEDMENFEVDFNGSTLVTHGISTPVAIINSKKIKIKNLHLDNPETLTVQARVVEVNETAIKVSVEKGLEQFAFESGRLYARYGKEYMYVGQNTIIEFDGRTGEIAHGTGDEALGDTTQLRYERIDEEHIIIRGATRVPSIGDFLILTMYCRAGAGVFASSSQELFFENVKIHACYGMGMLVQFCHNVTVDGCATERINGRMYTANADATHFVCCSGVVKIEGCSFEGQYDDALNIHGIFLRVIDKLSDREVLVKQMHYQATGLPILEKGNKIQALEPDSLIPYTENVVSEVEIINDEILRVAFTESIENINVGDNIENLDKSPELIFRNNIVRDNRARGILIAAKGRVLIENNYFHTAGPAILFESDGKWWFESGATTDVTIRNNHFDRCRHGAWGTSVIQYVKREKINANCYYHGTVRIIDNQFDMYNENAMTLDNINEVIIIGNGSNRNAVTVDLSHCGKTELQHNGFNYKKG